ncbi:hypothetical protein [Sulfurovum lithotrophicum]|nr:hypothetical protein [Sulfurovum lithotrophicum]
MNFFITKAYFRVFIAVVLATVLCSAEEENSIYIETSNNINLKGQTSHPYGDNFNTGTLKLKYTTDTYAYSVNMTAYTQKYSELDSILTSKRRIDTLEFEVTKKVKIIQGKNYRCNINIGTQLLLSGDFGGAKLQNTIHEHTDSDEVEIPYSDDKHNVIGIQGEINYLYNINKYINIYSDLKSKIYSDTSNITSAEIGTLLTYRFIDFKLSLGAKHIKPIQQELVKILTINKNPHYIIGEVDIQLPKGISVNIGTLLDGDHPYGNNSNDPYSYFRIAYKF